MFLYLVLFLYLILNFHFESQILETTFLSFGLHLVYCLCDLQIAPPDSTIKKIYKTSTKKNETRQTLTNKTGSIGHPQKNTSYIVSIILGIIEYK